MGAGMAARRGGDVLHRQASHEARLTQARPRPPSLPGSDPLHQQSYTHAKPLLLSQSLITWRITVTQARATRPRRQREMRSTAAQKMHKAYGERYQADNIKLTESHPNIGSIEARESRIRSSIRVRRGLARVPHKLPGFGCRSCYDPEAFDSQMLGCCVTHDLEQRAKPPLIFGRFDHPARK